MLPNLKSLFVDQVSKDFSTTKSSKSLDDRVEDLEYMMDIDREKIKKHFIDFKVQVKYLLKELEEDCFQHMLDYLYHYCKDFEHVKSAAMVRQIQQESPLSDHDRSSSRVKVFDIIEEQCNFIECDLLIDIVERFGNELEKEAKDCYKGELKTFFEKRK